MNALSQQEINQLPPEERLEALDEKVAEITNDRPDLAKKLSEPVPFDPRKWAEEHLKWAPKFFFWSFAAFLVVILIISAITDHTPIQYRAARDRRQHTIDIADAQYKLDVAKVDLEALTKTGSTTVSPKK